MTTQTHWWSSSSGRIELELPEDCIEECSQYGRDATPYVEQWLLFGHILNQFLALDRSLIEKELQEFGAWDDLATVPRSTLHERLLWIAACDLNEEIFAHEHDYH